MNFIEAIDWAIEEVRITADPRLDRQKINFFEELRKDEKLELVLSANNAIEAFFRYAVKCDSSSVTREPDIPVNSAFVWSYTEEGPGFWRNISIIYSFDPDRVLNNIQRLKKELIRNRILIKGSDVAKGVADIDLSSSINIEVDGLLLSGDTPENIVVIFDGDGMADIRSRFDKTLITSIPVSSISRIA